MKLQVNFVGDWIDSLRESLFDEWGYDVSKVTDDEIPQLYFNAVNRHPQAKVRKVVLSDTFSCPRELETGWKLLRTRVEDGEDLTPNLSKLVNKIRYKDLMLNDWGIHHFHLGDKMEGSFVNRNKPLLFALLKDDKFYVIDIYDHSSWLDRDIIEVIHRNWPKAIENKIIRGVQESKGLSEDQQYKFRKSGINLPITVDDGTTYFLIGGGLAGGVSTFVTVREIDKQKLILKELELLLQHYLMNRPEVFEGTDYNGISDVNALLSIQGSQYTVVIPEYGISIDIERLLDEGHTLNSST